MSESGRARPRAYDPPSTIASTSATSANSTTTLFKIAIWDGVSWFMMPYEAPSVAGQCLRPDQRNRWIATGPNGPMPVIRFQTKAMPDSASARHWPSRPWQRSDRGTTSPQTIGDLMLGGHQARIGTSRRDRLEPEYVGSGTAHRHNAPCGPQRSWARLGHLSGTRKFACSDLTRLNPDPYLSDVQAHTDR